MTRHLPTTTIYWWGDFLPGNLTGPSDGGLGIDRPHQRHLCACCHQNNLVENHEENDMDMDQAAEKAAQELQTSMSAVDIASWWAKHYQQAGHKRLGRVLMAWAAQKTPAQTPQTQAQVNF